MKKIALTAVVAFGIITISACNKENVQPQRKVISFQNAAMGIISGDITFSDKSNLSQGDGRP